jgi:hypothetical protein
MMKSVSSSDFTLTSQLLENENRRGANVCNHELLHIYVLVVLFFVSIVGFLIYMFVFA